MAASSLPRMRRENLVFKKQISFYVDRSDWLLIRSEAARRGIPMTELFRESMEPELNRLRDK